VTACGEKAENGGANPTKVDDNHFGCDKFDVRPEFQSDLEKKYFPRELTKEKSNEINEIRGSRWVDSKGYFLQSSPGGNCCLERMRYAGWCSPHGSSGG
jgi:hypothetical protein